MFQVFKKDELQVIADLIKYDVMCIAMPMFQVFKKDELQVIADLCIKYEMCIAMAKSYPCFRCLRKMSSR